MLPTQSDASSVSTAPSVKTVFRLLTIVSFAADDRR